MVDNNTFKDLEKLAPEERIKRLRELEAAIESEKNDQLKATKDLMDKSTEEMEQETEEEKLERLFAHVKEEQDSLENTVAKEKAESIEQHVQYSVTENEVDKVVNPGELYQGPPVEYKKDEVKESYQQGADDTVSTTWKQLGYDKPRFT